MPGLVPGQALSGWTTCNATGQRTELISVISQAGGFTTAITLRMLQLFVLVSGQL